MKESYYTQERPRSLIFRESFSNESECVNNGGDPTDVTFENGVGGFNGSSSLIDYPNTYLNQDGFSVRVNVNANLLGTEFIASKISASETGFIVLSTASDIRFYSGGSTAAYAAIAPLTDGNVEVVGVYDGTNNKIYIDGAFVSNSSSSASPDQFSADLFVGAKYDSTSYYNGEIELLEIYNYALSAEEVSNLYDNSRHIKPTGSTLLEVTAENGVIEDRIGNTITNTDVGVVRSGGIYAHDYNGSTSNLLSSQTLPTGDFTVSVWARSNESGSDETFIDVNATTFYMRKQTTDLMRTQVYDGVTNLILSGLPIGDAIEWSNYIGTFDSTAKTYSFYSNGEYVASITNGAFTSIAGGLPIYTGMYSTGILHAYGKMGEVIVDGTVWTDEMISQYYSSTKHKYSK